MALFVDLTKAYDSVNQLKLLKILERREILSGDEMNLLKWLLRNTFVSFGGAEVEVSTGVPQGSTLSPYLFNI
jgi:hypothetical protein